LRRPPGTGFLFHLNSHEKSDFFLVLHSGAPYILNSILFTIWGAIRVGLASSLL
jgi:hypothetical protein